MRIGIVAEFNPLHSGHKYLIDKAKNYIEKNGDADIICVMSEYFTQRGEVAMVGGYTRAEEAVRVGCDLVIALPYVASVSYSDDFAKKSVEILSDAGITHLIFGTENTDLDIFEEIYIKQQSANQEEYKQLLKKGYNHATINNKLFGLENKNPNFMLAYSYYKAIKQYAPNIKLVPIERSGQTLNEEKLENNIHLSATTIRKNIKDKKIENYISENMLKSILSKKIVSEEDFFELIKYKILSLGVEKLAKIYDINEGLENRIYRETKSAKNYKELVEKISTKRYSKKKIQRILLHILTDTTKEEYRKNFTTKTFRVLAARKEKTYLIREINKKNKITLVSKLNKENSDKFVQDIKASDIYNLVSEDEDIYKKKIYLHP